MKRKWTVFLAGVATSYFAMPLYADSAQLEDSIWLYDDSERLVEAALKAGGVAEMTIDEDPDDDELLVCNGTWQTEGDNLDVTCSGSDTYSGTMLADSGGGPAWSRLPEGTETGPMREAFIESVMEELARLEAQYNAPAEEQAAPPAEAQAEVSPEMMGEEQRSSITGGSFAWGDSGGLQIDMAFEGEMIAFDMANGSAMVVSSGMSKADFKALAEENGVAIDALSDDEYKVGSDIFVFENGVLTRTRTGY